MKEFFVGLRWALLVAAVNMLVGQLLRPYLGGNPFLAMLPFHVVTLAVIFWSGLLTAGREGVSLAQAAWAGPVVLIVGHVLIRVVYLALTGGFAVFAEKVKEEGVAVNPTLGFLGMIVLGTIVFLPLAAVVSLLGGVVRRKVAKAAVA